jgi:hypothetical protein
MYLLSKRNDEFISISFSFKLVGVEVDMFPFLELHERYVVVCSPGPGTVIGGDVNP